MFRMILCLLLIAGNTVLAQSEVSDAKSLVTFGVMGDVPYDNYENELLPLQIATLPTDIPFAVHVGDIKRGGGPCDDAVYRKVAGMLSKSKAPIFIIPGDNEYNDCPDPVPAWEHWKTHFSKFDERWKHDLAVSRQPGREENFAFVKNRVLFVGVHVLGGRVHDAAEWKTRHADDVRWIGETLMARRGEIDAAVIFGHATPTAKQADFFGGLKKAATEFEKPVIYIHGDGHKFVRYHPFPEVKNLHAVQVDRGGIAPPIRLTVIPSAEDPFLIDRRLEVHPAGYPRNEGEAKERKKRDGG